jgi:outer membrane immunogenic protein
MNRLFLSAAVLVLTTGAALAADLPSRKAEPFVPPPPPPPMWTGFYVGINAGGGWGTSNGAYTASAPLLDQWASTTVGNIFNWDTPGIVGVTALANTGLANVNQSGFIGGAQVGYNYQFANRFLVGLEADFQGSTITGSGSYIGSSADAATAFGVETGYRNGVGWGRVSAGINWLGTVRGRIGYLVTPTLLLYGTGGLAYGGINASASHGFMAQTRDTFATIVDYTAAGTASIASTSKTLVGFAVGGGGEWMFFPNWSLKVEGLYYSLGNANFFGGPITTNYNWAAVYPGYPANYPLAVNLPSTRVSYNGVIARAGVNYHFNWGAAPVVAGY